MVKLDKYEVEVRDADTGYWKPLMRIIPAYRYKTQVRRWRFCFFTWRQETRTIINRSQADLQVRKRALYQARAYRSRGHDVRIKRYLTVNDRSEHNLVWENGTFLDC